MHGHDHAYIRLLQIKGAQSRLVQIEKFCSDLLFVICVNVLHPQPFLFLHSLSLSLWWFSLLQILNCYFQVSYHLKVINLYVAKITQNAVTELL